MKHYITEQPLPTVDRFILAAGGFAVRNLWMFPALRRRVRNRWVDTRLRNAAAATVHAGEVTFHRPARLRFHLVFPRSDTAAVSPQVDCPCEGDRSRCGCGAP